MVVKLLIVLDIQKYAKYGFYLGDHLGRLQPDRGQEGVHGRGPDHARRPRPVQHCHRLVQALRHLLARQPTSQRTSQERIAPESGLVWIVNNRR